MIDFSASACLFEIRINDYPVIHMDIEGQVASTIPINFAILESGKQSLSLTVMPNFGETKLNPKADLKFNLKLFDVANDFVFEKQFGEYQSKTIDEKSTPLIKYGNIFEAEVPYKLEAWQNGINLQDLDDSREKLSSAYKKLAQLIERKQFDEYKKLISQRENNMASSMYLSKSESTERIDDLIQDFNAGFKMKPIAEDSVMFLYGQSKVAMLKKPNGESALYLVNTETEEELMLDVAFYVPEGKTDFEII